MCVCGCGNYDKTPLNHWFCYVKVYFIIDTPTVSLHRLFGNFLLSQAKMKDYHVGHRKVESQPWQLLKIFHDVGLITHNDKQNFITSTCFHRQVLLTGLVAFKHIQIFF